MKKILYIVILLLLNMFLYSVLSGGFYDRVNNKTLMYCTICVFLCFVISLVFFSVIYIVLNPIIEKINDKIIEKKYKKNINLDYYREIINEYSIPTLCYCYGKSINCEDEFVAVLLKLQMQNEIEIVDNKINIINDERLSLGEKNLLSHCVNKTFSSYKEVSSIIKNNNRIDFISSDLYDEKHNKNAEKLFIPLIILYPLSFIIMINLKETLSILAVLGILVSGPFLLNIASVSKLSLNKKGLEIKHKLMGLKSFLEDFSSIGDRNISQIEIFKYYVIYAIIFDIKGILDKDAMELYKKYCKLFDKNIV